MKQFILIKTVDGTEIRAKIQVNDVDANQHVTIIYMEGIKNTYFESVINYKLGDRIHINDMTELAKTLYPMGIKVIMFGDTEEQLIKSPKLTITSSATPTIAVAGTSTITHTSDSTGAITYESSDETKATVSDEGVITGVAAGTATITIKQAAKGEYAAESKTVAVTVTE